MQRRVTDPEYDKRVRHLMAHPRAADLEFISRQEYEARVWDLTLRGQPVHVEKVAEDNTEEGGTGSEES